MADDLILPTFGSRISIHTYSFEQDASYQLTATSQHTYIHMYTREREREREKGLNEEVIPLVWFNRLPTRRMELMIKEYTVVMSIIFYLCRDLMRGSQSLNARLTLMETG